VNISFGPFMLDAPARQLRRGTESIHLSPKAFDLLALLAQRRPEAISKSEILDRLWPGTFVSEGNLAVLVAEIRDALGDSARRPTFIRTVQRFGYAFSGNATETDRRRTMSNVTPCWLAWGEKRAPLPAGESLLGRDPSADVRIDAVGVSRRHAIILVADDEVTVRDLSSKNGTFVGDARVTSTVPVTDGTEIRLGPVAISFHRTKDIGSTETFNNARRVRSGR
jgi:DNA-binding winged helix-turn-helix (wHTH) protein